MTTGIGDILNKLEKVKGMASGEFIACCPAHADKKPSLTLKQVEDRIVLHCQAGCTPESVVKALGLEMADLFIKEDAPPLKAKIVATYDYIDESGKPLFQVVRMDPKSFRQRHKNGNSEWAWNLDGVRRVLYRLPEVLAAESVYLVEGEKDVDNLRAAGEIATTSPGGADNWKIDYAQFLQGKTVTIIPDNDKPGYRYARDVAESLDGLAKEIKIILLPDESKDVSDWLALNNDVKKLREMEQPITVLLGKLPEDQYEPYKTPNGYEFVWDKLGLTVRVDRLNDDLEGIIRVLHGEKVVHISKINLMAPRSLAELSKRLSKIREFPWEKTLDMIATRCADYMAGGGVTEDVSNEPLTMKVPYLLFPIIPEKQPTTLFSAGGKGKSTLIDYFAVLVQYGVCAQGNLPFMPQQANAMILDWEADAETHRRYITAIKRGLGIHNSGMIAYRHMEVSLAVAADTIRAEIERLNIGFLIVDSMMAATVSGNRNTSESQLASEYYNIINSFGVTSLTVDHVNRIGMNSENGVEAPYGSVVKYNRSRSQFEFRMGDDFDDADHKEIALVHRKFNVGRKLKPIGISVDYENNTDDELVSLRYSSCELKDNPALSRTLPQWEQIKNFILDHGGKCTFTEIANGTAISSDNVRSNCNRRKEIFWKCGVKGSESLWGVKTHAP